MNNLKENIARMEQELADMKKKLEEPEKDRVFGYLPEKGSEERYFTLQSEGGFGTLRSLICWAGNSDATKYKGLFWQTEMEAENFADALNVIIELRACEGVKAFVPNKINCFIKLHDNKIVTEYNKVYCSFISPAFKSKAYAEQAVKKLGKKRIKKAFRVLSGMEK